MPGSSDDESSSDSDSDEEVRVDPHSTSKQDTALDDDEEAGAGGIVSPDQVRTKNEVAELNVVIPEVEEVGADEVLEKVGEITSIIDKVAIVKGTPSQVVNRASERALDSDTLLVFEDRKVLGYVSVCSDIRVVEFSQCCCSDMGDLWSNHSTVLSCAIQRSLSAGSRKSPSLSSSVSHPYPQQICVHEPAQTLERE